MARKANSDNADALAGTLRQRLSTDYAVVSEPHLQRMGLAAVVLAPAGLFLLHARDWEWHITVDDRGDWRATLPNGRALSLPDPADAVAEADAGVRVLLKDEPALECCDIQPLIVCTSANVDLSNVRDASPRCVATDELVDLLEQAAYTATTLLDPEDIQRIAALLTSTPAPKGVRASKPFEFRALGFWGLRRKASTVRDMVWYMRRHSEEAFVDMRTSALERWFADLGEQRLAELTREIALRPESSPRVAVETFLLRAGLSPRPRIAVRPRRLNAGHVVLGDVVKVRMRLRKPGGPGYLFGSLETNNQWIQVSPTTFEGNTEAVVTLDTKGLIVTGKPTQAYLTVRSSASDAPLSVPVVNHVHPEPAPAARYLARPLAGMAIAGGLGALLGWVLGLVSGAAPAWAAAIPALPQGAPTFYALVVGVLWGLLGLWRGFSQRPAWPLAYALCRWLARTGAWLAGSLAIMTVWYWVMGLVVPAWRVHTLPALRAELPLLACLAALPGTLGEVLAARGSGDEVAPHPRWTNKLGRAATATALGGMLLVGSLLLYRPLNVQGILQDRAQAARALVGDRPESIQETLNQWIDKIYLRLYDRRASAN